MKTAAQPQIIIEQIPVAQIRPSPTNPRKHIDRQQLAELAESIRNAGVRVPLLLRPEPVPAGEVRSVKQYEIVGGERRWRAAQIAGITSVPAIVRVMTDRECREAQLIDNLQRADLSPMEEAEGYESLIQEAAAAGFAITDEQLAAKVGKPVGYVRSRRKLLELIPEARAALAEGFLTFGCALLIAKLQPADQEKVTARALDTGHDDAAAALKKVREDREEDRRFRANAEAKGTRLEPWEEEDGFEPISERDLKEWIADNITLDLAKASWPLDQPIEGVDAPACQACPKRSGSDTALFAELTAKADVCTDPECFAAKRKAFVQIATAAAKQSGAPLLKLSTAAGYSALKIGVELEKVKFKRGQWIEAGPGSCAHVQRGITEEGQVLSVCVEPKCKVHKHSLIAGGSAAREPKVDYEAERRKREEAQKAYVEAERPVRMAVCAEIRKKLKGAKLLRLAASLLAERGVEGLAQLRGIDAGNDAYDATLKAVRNAFAKAKDAEVEGWLLDAVVASHVMPREYWHGDRKRDREGLWEIGKLAGVDCDAVAKKATAPVAKAKPTPAKKVVAKKPAKAAAKKKAVRK